MNFDQCLISKRDNGIFAPSWIAGTSNVALLPAYIIEGINVPATCDKLYLAAFSQQNMPKHKKCPVPMQTTPEINIPFRIVSKLCYGTLRIYQQQVNRLFENTKSLVTCSRIGLTAITATKRGSSSMITYSGGSKKQRIKQNQISNYSELLCESESLATWSKSQTSLFEESETALTTNSQMKSRSLRIVKVREITVCEIEEDFQIPAVDAEDGFGNATEDELAEFVDLFAGNQAITNSRKTTFKRKKSVEFANNEIHCEDKPTEKQRREKSSIVAAEYGMNSYISFEQNNSFEIESPQDTVTFFSSQNVEEFRSSSDIITSNFQTVYHQQHSKIIIDQRKEFDTAEALYQYNNYSKLQIPIKECLKKLEKKKLPTAKNLLKRLGKSKVKIKIDFKQQRIVCKETQRREYLNILRAIFECDVDTNLANLIFPKWNKIATGLRKKRKRKLQCADENWFGNATYSDVTNNMANNTRSLPMLLRPVYEKTLREGCGEDTVQNDWSPFSVINKLLNIWRSSNSNEINVHHIFSAVRNHMTAASAFASLLVLIANSYIVVSKISGTLKMEKITIGPKAKKLMIDRRKA